MLKHAKEAAPVSEEAWLKRNHPQYMRLAEKYPQLSSVDPNGSMGTTSQALNVKIIPMAPTSCHLDALHKRLPSTLTVGRLKTLCARAFQLDYSLQILHYREKSGDRKVSVVVFRLLPAGLVGF